MQHPSHSDFKRIVYVFQGGGALGVYQTGVFQALSEKGYHPNWLIGTSIGAINASIIAGNPPEKRIEKLHQFWNTITQDIIPFCSFEHETLRRLFNFFSAERSIFFGNHDFFYPNVNTPLFTFNSTPDKISFYITEPLKELLTALIDFDLINQSKVRLTLGAVEIEHGATVYFDNQKDLITPAHIMASCALPPGFPAVEIEGKYYWDGGILSNAPVHALLSEPVTEKTLGIAAHLFDSYGLLPKTLDDVLKRYKDIIYSSHFRSRMEIYKTIQGLRYILSKYKKHIPKEIQNDPELKKIMQSQSNIAPIHFVRFLYEAPNYELSTKDYDFSKLSMKERMEAGYRDAAHAIEKSPWLEPENENLGILVHDFHQDLEKLASIHKDTKKTPKQN